MSKYSVILADPPWYYNNRKTGGERSNKTKFGGGAMKHYPLMKDAELLEMAPFVDTLAADNCALFMWATMPRLDFGIELLKGGGFRYATTAFTWVKPNRTTPGYFGGPGSYTASNAEVVLLGVRGSMRPARKMLASVIARPKTEHSRKPDDVHKAIDLMYPDARKIELFARRAYPGWDAWGNQVETVTDPVTLVTDPVTLVTDRPLQLSLLTA
jgi:N6-adenosine-specific RNA methylase IME4